jgi:copper chaperone CopZ
MEHFICRCEHCGASYTYCTYGNDDGCTEQYCGACATAIKNALAKIPVRYIGAKYKIEDEAEIDKIIQIFNQEKERFDNSKSIKMVKVIPDWGYDKVEGCHIDKVEYYRCTKENGEVDVYVLNEYDLIEKKYTDKKYFNNKNHNRQYFLLSQLKFDKFKEHIKVAPMDKPTGKMFFNDIFEWDVIPPNTTDN